MVMINFAGTVKTYPAFRGSDDKNKKLIGDDNKGKKIVDNKDYKEGLLYKIFNTQNDINKSIAALQAGLGQCLDAAAGFNETLIKKGVIEPSPPIMIKRDEEFRNKNFQNGGCFERSKHSSFARIHQQRHCPTKDLEHDVKLLVEKMNNHENLNGFKGENDEEKRITVNQCTKVLYDKLKELTDLKKREKSPKSDDAGTKRRLKNEITGAGMYILRSFNTTINKEDIKISEETVKNSMELFDKDMRRRDAFYASIVRAAWIGGSIASGAGLSGVASPFAGAGLTGTMLGFTPNVTKAILTPRRSLT